MLKTFLSSFPLLLLVSTAALAAPLDVNSNAAEGDRFLSLGNFQMTEFS